MRSSAEQPADHDVHVSLEDECLLLMLSGAGTYRLYVACAGGWRSLGEKVCVEGV